MRRQQLADLARAYDLKNVQVDGTKEEMLIGLIAAEQAGAFKKPPVYPAYFACAMRSADDPVITNEDGSPSPIMARRMEWPKDHPMYVPTQEDAADQLEELREQAKELGILVHHKHSAETLAERIAARED